MAIKERTTLIQYYQHQRSLIRAGSLGMPSSTSFPLVLVQKTCLTPQLWLQPHTPYAWCEIPTQSALLANLCQRDWKSEEEPVSLGKRE